MYSQSEFSVGNMLVGANGKKARIIGIEGERVTLRIDNRDNPFYKKSKKVGTTVKKDDVIFRIILENTDSYTLQVRNMKSPFYKKPWKVGAMVKTSDGTIIKILKINPDTVDIDTRHPMVGKTLTFNINIISIQ
jgi:hypothetical protein